MELTLPAGPRHGGLGGGGHLSWVVSMVQSTVGKGREVAGGGMMGTGGISGVLIPSSSSILACERWGQPVGLRS